MVILGVLAMTLGFTVWVSGAVRSGMVIHKKVSSQPPKWVIYSLTKPRFPSQLLNSVFSATLRWLDVTPQGRIISRYDSPACLVSRTKKLMIASAYLA